MTQDSPTKALTEAIIHALKALAVSATADRVVLEHPGELVHGDYATNVALAYAKELKMPPRALAEKIVAQLKGQTLAHVADITIAGPGFINFILKREFFTQQIHHIIKTGKKFGTNRTLKGKKIVIDYTNPNPFKVFHIGHLMANAIGEALSRIVEAHGAQVIRVNYQGDIGLHVAKAVWGMLKTEPEFPKDNAPLETMIRYIGDAYVAGSAAYEGEKGDDAENGDGVEASKPAENPAKDEINLINKMIFERSNPKLMKIYNWGRKISLLNFEVIYKKLGTKFDHYFFESEVAQDGIAIVRDFEKRGIFTESEGAVVFKGEDYGLHTRVFITSAGLPTYETKEVGLTRIKFDKYNPDMSIVVTANEQSDYFRVVLKAIGLMFPYMAPKMKHISHGMLRFSSGKMSSRKGNVIAGEALLAEVAALARQRMSDEQGIVDVSVGAIKYSILKQAPGGDIVYDFDKSISFEGDSGPYLQYACVRARSLLVKAKKAKIKKVGGLFSGAATIPEQAILLEKILYRYPEIIERAGQTYEPHHIVTYLIELSAAFNNMYANETIVDASDKYAPYRVALTQAFVTVMENGLNVLGIRVPEKM
jgi:arginyl-tRNA synthetase